MLDRTEERFDLKPKRLAADTTQGTGKFLGWLVKEKKITPHIPIWEKSDRQDGIFSRSDFRWDKKRGVYICPNRKLLQTSGTVHDGRTLLYRGSKRDCDACPIRAKCYTTAAARKIPRDIHEDARDIARGKMKTKAFTRSRDDDNPEPPVRVAYPRLRVSVLQNQRLLPQAEILGDQLHPRPKRGRNRRDEVFGTHSDYKR